MIAYTEAQHKTLDIITLFHKAGSPASTRVANLLKQASANATSGATIDQASDHTAQTKTQRDQFELNITEDHPTADQVQTILEYVGKSGIPSVIQGARDEKDALKKFKESKDSLQRPLVSIFPQAVRHVWMARLTDLQVVDWNNGKAVAGENESEILKLVYGQK